MRLPRRPVRTLIRFLWRAAVAWFVVGADLSDRRAPVDGPPPKRRAEVIRESRRRDETP